MDTKAPYILAFDIGGTHTRMALLNKHANIEKTYPLVKTENIRHNIINNIKELIKNFVKTEDIRPNAISIGLAGQVDKHNNTVLLSARLPELNNINLASEIKKTFRIPTYIDRDVNFQLLHDIKIHNAFQAETVLGFYIGTGFGNAIYHNGKILRGKSGIAGEIGHMPLYGLNAKCKCGQRNCVETRCSGEYLEQIIKRKEEFADTDISDVFKIHNKHPDIKKFIRDLTVPILDEIILFDPNTVIIGGGIPAMNGFPRKEFEDMINERADRAKPNKIFWGDKNDLSGLFGGALFALKKL